MYPEIWDASTGTVSRVADYTQEKDGTSFQIELPAHGSIFVVFNKDNRNELSVVADHSTGDKTEISGPWKVSFPPDWGAPPSAVFDRLTSWTESENSGIKYFSGTAVYHNSFNVTASDSKELLIDLGEVRDVAEVFINGKSAGVLWKKPYQLNISQWVQPGTNDLQIEIVNMWSNRLTGDMLSDPKDRFCKTNQPYMNTEVWPGGDEPFKLQTAGLLGPVILLIEKE